MLDGLNVAADGTVRQASLTRSLGKTTQPSGSLEGLKGRQ
jgi:hypothetical protein